MPGNGVLNTEQGGVSYKPTEATACATAERNRLAWPHRRRGLASDGVRYADARSSVGRRFRSVTKLRIEWCVGSFLIAAAALKTPTRNGYNAQGVNLTFQVAHIMYAHHTS